MACSDNVCRGSQIDQNLIPPRSTDPNTLMTKAELFLKTFYNDHKLCITGVKAAVNQALIIAHQQSPNFTL